MKLLSIEPTPSPNSMKINLSESLPQGESKNYSKKQKEDAPSYLKELLEIEGVTGVFQVANFIALERHPKVDWKLILDQVRSIFDGGDAPDKNEIKTVIEDAFGESKVYVHMFRQIPMQVKVNDGLEEKRFGLPDRFKAAAMHAQVSSENIVKERQWKDFGIRYGNIDEIGFEVVEEISASYDESRLNELVEAALKKEEQRIQENVSYVQFARAFESNDWKVRFATLEKMNPEEVDIPILAIALNDEKASIRRLATVYLGMIETDKVLPYLFQALKDSSVTVRRTAGDCLSDIGNPKAIPPMIAALKDKNKLVRWRAAMFLYEVGDETALKPLKEAEDDSEFEVSLQVKMAIKRIESGEEAAGSVWQQMTNARKGK